jgi:hypothetical protein
MAESSKYREDGHPAGHCQRAGFSELKLPGKTFKMYENNPNKIDVVEDSG